MALLDASLDDLRHEPDARRAVVAAYARMEGGLAALGFPREPSETPGEYLERAVRVGSEGPLAAHPVAVQALGELTALAERARFSTLPIDETMRARAIDALEHLRDELRSRAAEASVDNRGGSRSSRLTVLYDAADRRREGRRSRRRAIVATILSLTAAAAAAASVPDRLRLIAQIEIAIVGAIAVMIATGELRRAAPLPPPSSLDRRPRARATTGTALPLDLVRISRRLAAAEASAADARRHLGPLVSQVAADRLRGHSHTRVDQDSVYAHLPRPVPPELTLVLDPALAGLDTRQMPGLDARGSDALVRALEDL